MLGAVGRFGVVVGVKRAADRNDARAGSTKGKPERLIRFVDDLSLQEQEQDQPVPTRKRKREGTCKR